PGRHDLDAACGARPVYLAAHDGHTAWVSSSALARAGIGASTPDPAGGRIGRDAAGEPDGLLFENAMELVTAHLPEPSLEEDTDALAGALAECAALGVTGVHDFEDERAFRAFARLGERG